MWNGVAIFVNAFISVAYAAMEHARCSHDGLDPNSTARVFGSGIVYSFRDSGEAGGPHLAIVVAMPHDVLGGGPFALALWVIAFVGVNKPSLIEPIRGPNASRDDGFKDAGFVGVAFVLVLGVLFIEIGPGGLDVNEGFNSYHVLPVTLAFGIVTSGTGGASLVFVASIVIFIEDDFAFGGRASEPVVGIILADSFTEVIE